METAAHDFSDNPEIGTWDHDQILLGLSLMSRYHSTSTTGSYGTLGKVLY
jgi:hypothetical protein